MNTAIRFRKLHADDTPFVIALLNDPQCLQFIGDRGVYSEADAKCYIRQNLQHFDEHGYGLWVVEAYLSDAVGLCGLLNRNVFKCPDLGFAFLPKGRGKGIASAAVTEIIEKAKNEFGLTFLTALCDPGNTRSIALLKNHGFVMYGQYFFPNSRKASNLLWLNLS
ncbi:GNAT family N-acetyltransferase [Alteromonas sp. ASW11-130]|uniref:GNAT family N-acetyltransferase n=1 Tax=Alteromonas sp. ASW11-130 TaxID=3015775 RepID=UPI002241BDE6|nr:GNAT family N-acetyltransferase [Alteromonas sp. ASW11-130]